MIGFESAGAILARFRGGSFVTRGHVASGLGQDEFGPWASAECRVCGAHVAVRPVEPGATMADALSILFDHATELGWRLTQGPTGIVAWFCPCWKGRMM